MVRRHRADLLPRVTRARVVYTARGLSGRPSVRPSDRPPGLSESRSRDSRSARDYYMHGGTGPKAAPRILYYTIMF